MGLVESRHLPLLRKAEIETVQRWFKPGMRVLEIGGGNGYQASVIALWGCEVDSIDLPQTEATKQHYYPVQDYDGEHIPFSHESFDIVFSSNVLEHVELLSSILLEIQRVLKPSGLAVHILPSPAWRAWTSTAHYLALLRYAIGSRQAGIGGSGDPSVQRALQAHSLGFLIKRVLFAGPHGVFPNALSELYYFSKSRWMKLFQKNGFALVEITTNGLFYTGYGLFPRLSLGTRRRLARILGSACHIFVLKKKSP